MAASAKHSLPLTCGPVSETAARNSGYPTFCMGHDGMVHHVNSD